MSGNTFTWLLDTTFTRRGFKLERGKTYPVDDFAPAVVEEWVRTGAISLDQKTKKKNEV